MPQVSLDAVDAIELAELLQFLAGWLIADHGRLEASLLAYAGHPASGPEQLGADLNRFAFLLLPDAEDCDEGGVGDSDVGAL